MSFLLKDKALREKRDLAQQVKRAILESPESDHPAKTAREEWAKHDERIRRRGIPVIGQRGGLGGTVRDTQPETAVLQKIGREEAIRKRAGLDE